MSAALALALLCASTASSSIAVTLLIVDAERYAPTVGGTAIIWLVGLASAITNLSAQLKR